MLIKKLINYFHAKFYDKTKNNGKGKSKDKSKKGNFYNVIKGGNSKNKKSCPEIKTVTFLL